MTKPTSPPRSQPTTNWDAIAEAFLHDPPDKALAIRSHESRATRYLEATGLGSAGHGRADDSIAAIAERIPMPSGRRRRQGWDGITVGPGPRNGHARALTLQHPLSGDPRTIQVPRTTPAAIRQIEELLEQITAQSGGRERFLRLWRLLPDELAALHQAYAALPADTRLPDHTIWHHADVTAALTAAGAMRAHSGGPAFLSISLGPVQEFIAAARSLRDLWAGSFILSHLAFEAALPLIETLGPQCLVFPYLRRNPRLDTWLRTQGGLRKLEKRSPEALLSPCLPNKLLALVPTDRAEALEKACVAGARNAWLRLADQVRDLLLQQGAEVEDLVGFEEQIEGFFEVRSVWFPWRDKRGQTTRRILPLLGTAPNRGGSEADWKAAWEATFPGAAAVRALADALPPTDRPGYDQKKSGEWQLRVTYAMALLGAARSVRHIPPHAAPDDTRPKCTILGTLEAMGPKRDHDAFRDFWDQAPEKLRAGGIRLRPGEQLSAVSLVKRFAPHVLRSELGLRHSTIRFSDTATVAASRWLTRHGISEETCRHEGLGWSGHWLHQPARVPAEESGEDPVPPEIWSAIQAARRKGPPPAYLAILHLDGDHMGQWLRGERSPKLGDLLHKTLQQYFQKIPGEDNQEKIACALHGRRPIGPALHAAISEALATFSVEVVPRLVREAGGELIYAGGDDVVAVLPVEGALRCAARIARGFSGLLGPEDGWPETPRGYVSVRGHARLTMGPKAHVSAGLAVCHYKDDLRAALRAARAAEQAAKDHGRARLGLCCRRRSGEHALQVVRWEEVPALQSLVDDFLEGATDRWAYKLRGDAAVLDTLPHAAGRAELRRLIHRTEERDELRQRLETHATELWDKTSERADPSENGVGTNGESKGDGDGGDGGCERFVERFAILAQSASFLARGREKR